MANLRQLAIDLIARDGLFSGNEIKIIKKHLFLDGRISRDEAFFLAEIRAAVVKKAKANPTDKIDKFFLDSLQDNVLGNGIISSEEIEIIRKYVLQDKKLLPHARKFLDGLRKKATSLPPEFDALYGHLPKTKK
jgi:hypothetical protein